MIKKLLEGKSANWLLVPEIPMFHIKRKHIHISFGGAPPTKRAICGVIAREIPNLIGSVNFTTIHKMPRLINRGDCSNLGINFRVKSYFSINVRTFFAAHDMVSSSSAVTICASDISAPPVPNVREDGSTNPESIKKKERARSR